MSGVKLPASKLMAQLEMVGLADRAHSKIKTYSQGMKQRLGIATALLHDPSLIILDEPMNGLDPQGIADMRHLIIHLSRDQGKTVFVSSHLLNEMEQIADSMLIINKGRKMAEGSKDELLNPETMQVELITDDQPSSLAIIKGTNWAPYLKQSDHDSIIVDIPKEKIPSLNRMLVEKGINVLSLRPKHSLEDFFLSLTAR
jgi:ABC-type multidrug transport system ATPase subunit